MAKILCSTYVVKLHLLSESLLNTKPDFGSQGRQDPDWNTLVLPEMSRFGQGGVKCMVGFPRKWKTEQAD